MARAYRGHGAIKAGRLDAGLSELREAISWFDSSQLGYVRSVLALWLADGYIRAEKRSSARPLIEDVLETSHAAGCQYLEGVAHRVLGDCLSLEAPVSAEQHLEKALSILDKISARNELAKAMVTRSLLRRRAGDLALSRQLLEQAHLTFEMLGTRDEPARIRAALLKLDNGSTSR